MTCLVLSCLVLTCPHMFWSAVLYLSFILSSYLSTSYFETYHFRVTKLYSFLLSPYYTFFFHENRQLHNEIKRHCGNATCDVARDMQHASIRALRSNYWCLITNHDCIPSICFCSVFCYFPLLASSIFTYCYTISTALFSTFKFLSLLHSSLHSSIYSPLFPTPVHCFCILLQHPTFISSHLLLSLVLS